MLAVVVVAAAAFVVSPFTPANATVSPPSLSGHVTDGGQPVADVPVTLESTEGFEVASAVTDASGGYDIAQIMPGYYRLRFQLSPDVAQYFPQQLDPTAGQVIAFGRNAHIVVDESVVAHGSLAGTVFTDAGTPAEGAYVIAWDEQSQRRGFALADADGGYQFNYLPVGDYHVSVDLPGVPYTDWAEGKTTEGSADRVAVVAGQQSTQDVHVLPRATLTGHVSGIPFNSFPYMRMYDATTNAEAAFVSIGFDGSYNVSTFEGTYVLKLFLPDGNVLGPIGPVTLTAAQPAVRDIAIPSERFIGGSLKFDDGAPAAFASVTAANDNGATIRATTGSSGSFSLPVLPGTYTVEFRTEHQQQWAHQKTTAADADPIVVSTSSVSLQERLPVGGSISVTATDAPTGDPVNSFCASVEGSLPADSHDMPCTSNGTIVFNHLPAGTYTVSTSTFDGVYAGEESTDVAVSVGETTAVAVTMRHYASVEVHAQDADTGAAVNGFCAQLLFTGESQCTTGGAVTFAGVVGEQAVMVTPTSGYLPSDWQEVTTTVGETAVVAVPVQRAGTVTVQARDAATGAPVENACVELVDPKHPSSLGSGTTTCTDATGTATLPQVRAGGYNVFTWARDGVHGHQWLGTTGRGTGAEATAQLVKVKAGKTAALTILLDNAGAITGVVTDKATGQPLSMATVGISSPSFNYTPVEPLIYTDDQGHYTINGLGPYAWPVYVSAYGLASQWSGKAPDRLSATGVQVEAGATATYNVALTKGTRLRILVGDSNKVPPAHGAYVVIYNADTRDEVLTAFADSLGVLDARVLGTQNLKISYQLNFSERSVSGWYRNAAGFGHAKIVTVEPGDPQTIKITVDPS